MRASEVIALLETKHANDVFASEVKDGPTWNSAPMRRGCRTRGRVEAVAGRAR